MSKFSLTFSSRKNSNSLLVERIKIQGYKVLKEIEFDIRLLTVLVGENSTGKTTILESIHNLVTKNILSNLDKKFTINQSTKPIIFEIGFKGELEVLEDLQMRDPENPAIVGLRVYVINPAIRFVYFQNKASTEIKFEDNYINFRYKNSPRSTGLSFTDIVPRKTRPIQPFELVGSNKSNKSRTPLLLMRGV